MREHVDRLTAQGYQWPPPYLSLNPNFASGGTVDELLAEGLLHENATQAQLNKGTMPRLDDLAHSDPRHNAMPGYWVPESEIDERLGSRWACGWLLGWRDIARSTDERTLISTVIPRTAVGDKFLLALPPARPACLHANLSSVALDYVTRQKYAGSSLKYYVVKQLPVLAPGRYGEAVPWDRGAGSRPMRGISGTTGRRSGGTRRDAT